MLLCDGLSLKVRDEIVFQNLGFQLIPNSIVYLRGFNGSGKSSLLRMISGLQKPNDGKISYYGYKLGNIDKPYANYIGHNIGLKDELTVFENLKLCARLYNSESSIDAALHYFNLKELIDAKVYTLSAGNRQKVALARLMACESDLWLLDEVDAHLDVHNKALLYNAISSKAMNGGIIIITSHSKPELHGVIEIDLGDYI